MQYRVKGSFCLFRVSIGVSMGQNENDGTISLAVLASLFILFDDV